jgi:uncharacterized membrane protein YqiK
MIIDNIPLRDKHLAKFQCDVVTWVIIENLEVAAERLGAIAEEAKRIRRSGSRPIELAHISCPVGFEPIAQDISAFIKAVTRNATMKFDIVRMMSERKEFSESVEAEIGGKIAEWGLKVVDLEVIHFGDVEEFTVIKDLETRQATIINTETRKVVAEKTQEAEIAESDALRQTQFAIAKNEEEYKTQQIIRDEKLGIKEQEKNLSIQQQTQKANVQQIEAERTLTVGKAEYNADAVVKKAEGDASATKKTGEATAEVTRLTGTAQADVIEAKGTAEGVAIDKKATAQKLYETPQAMSIEIITKYFDTYARIQESMFTNFGPALEKANIRVISTGEAGTFLGLPISAKSGVAMGGLMEGLKESTGIDLAGLVKVGAEAVEKAIKAVTPKDTTKPKKQKKKTKIPETKTET